MPDLGNIIKSVGGAYLDTQVPGLGTALGGMFGSGNSQASEEARRIAEENKANAEKKDARAESLFGEMAGGYQKYLGESDRLYKEMLGRYAPGARTPSGYADSADLIDRNTSNILRNLPATGGLSAGVGRQSMFDNSQQKVGAFNRGRVSDENMYNQLIQSDPRFKYLTGLTGVQGQEALYQERGSKALTDASRESFAQQRDLGTGEQSLAQGGLSTLFSDPKNLSKLGEMFSKGFGTKLKDNTPQEGGSSGSFNAFGGTPSTPTNYGSNLNMSGNVGNSGLGSPNYVLGLGSNNLSKPSTFGLGSSFNRP